MEKVLGSIPSYSIFALVSSMDCHRLLLARPTRFATSFARTVFADSESRMALPAPWTNRGSAEYLLTRLSLISISSCLVQHTMTGLSLPKRDHHHILFNAAAMDIVLRAM